MTLSPEAEIARFLRRLKWYVLAAGILWMAWLLTPVLIPFALSVFLGWLGDPLVDRIERAGVSRGMAVTSVFLLILLVLVLILMIFVPLIERQVMTLINTLPQMHDWVIRIAIPWIEQKTGSQLRNWLDPEQLIQWMHSNWEQAGGVARGLFGYVSRSGFVMVTWVINLVLLPILSFYFLRDWDKWVERVATAIPRPYTGTVSRLVTEVNEVLGAFIRGQFLVMLALGVIYAVGLSLVGLKLGLLIGLIAGLISFIPYLGAITGVVLALIAVIVQVHGLDLKLLVLVGGVFVVGQLLESYVLTPRIVGDKIGLHPVAVIFSVMAGGQLFGFVGMLLALPVSAVVNVLLRYAHERYIQGEFYRGECLGGVLDQHKRDENRDGGKGSV
ncbi:AI-2E family transporter [Xylella taiwanensis]|uniref:AI-2E family transporter n=1 Tax=Xylella taiwanensis TaxID=1444770 RepID=Z9JMN1_9GAMM|nr:AI-2E family transporter [Xylella taiwanensis]AXI84054.1 membrane protein [Xylella taiwanensis]EWS79026.1 membrane protein [Xylella taiwanensis]MCD8457168.1 AI-2E family transporter [Xylella taiwanensis]MCD8459577.1 AI-2E family transporter [Xylella taiwanensis]MCD8461556.1 AI-2E family transporter [Xylella taiwanensis]